MCALLKPAENQLRLYHSQMPALGSQESSSFTQARATLRADSAAKDMAAESSSGRAAAEHSPAAAPSRLCNTEHLAQEEAAREQEGVPASQQAVVPAKAEDLKLETPLSNGTAAVADQRLDEAVAASVKHTQALPKPAQLPTADPAADPAVNPAAEPAAATLGQGAPRAAQPSPLRQYTRKRAAPSVAPIQLAARSEAGAPGRSELQSPQAEAKSGGKAPAAELHKRQRPSKEPESPGSAERTNSNQGPGSRKRKAKESSPQASTRDSDSQRGNPPGSGHKKAKRRGPSEQEAPWPASSRKGSRQAVRAAVSAASSSDSEQEAPRPASGTKENRQGGRQLPSTSAVRPAVGQEPAPAATGQPVGKQGKSRPSSVERRAALEHGPAPAALPAAAPAAAAEQEDSKQSKAPTSGDRKPALQNEPAAPAAAMAQDAVIDLTKSDEEDQESVPQGSEEDSGSEGGQTGTLK